MNRSHSAAASAEVAPVRNHPGQGPAPRLSEQIPEPGLGGALRIPADWRAAALAPRRPDLLLDLTLVGQPVLRVPDRPARALDLEDVTSGRTNGAHPANRTPISGHIGDTKVFRGTLLNRKILDLQGLRSAAGGDRTHDLRIKSPLLCQLSYGGLGP